MSVFRALPRGVPENVELRRCSNEPETQDCRGQGHNENVDGNPFCARG